MSPWIALVLLLTVMLMLGCAILVGRARARHGIRAPATSGHPDFERAFRVQMNTIEASLMFLPALLVAAAFGDPRWAAGFGALWLLGRALYAVTYAIDAAKRGAGFVIGKIALAALVVQGGWGVLQALRGA